MSSGAIGGLQVSFQFNGGTEAQCKAFASGLEVYVQATISGTSGATTGWVNSYTNRYFNPSALIEVPATTQGTLQVNFQLQGVNETQAQAFSSGLQSKIQAALSGTQFYTTNWANVYNNSL